MADGNTQAFTDNKDGTYNYEVEPGKPTKFVKESDLLAVKESSERKSGEFMAQLAEANRIKDETHQNFLKEKAAKEQFETVAKDLDTYKTKASEWETKHKVTEESSKKLQEQLLSRTKSHIGLRFGVKEDVFKDKTLDDVLGIEKALEVVGPISGKKPNFDGSGGGGVGGKPVESNDERLDRILTEAHERNKK